MAESHEHETVAANGARHGEEPAICKYFRTLIKYGASDLHLKADSKPRIRIGGQIKVLAGEALNNEQIMTMMFEIMEEPLKRAFTEKGAVDFAYDLKGSDRFRINVFRQRGLTSVAARRVSRRIPTFEELHLPLQLSKIADYHQGLILLSGITGSGKSTTIAAMIEHINQTRACHIITIEDPIEYIFEDKKAFINQREIGIDVGDFYEALRYLMREDPDVVLVGELRDHETFAAALQASETGHLVFGTIHASSTSQTITRLLDLFPADERGLIRQSLVFNLRAIITQKLLPSILEGTERVPAVEIMINNPSIRKLIAEERDSDILEVVKNSYSDGMQDFSESLRQLVEKEWIEQDVAFDASPNPEELRMRLKGIQTSKTGILG